MDSAAGTAVHNILAEDIVAEVAEAVAAVADPPRNSAADSAAQPAAHRDSAEDIAVVRRDFAADIAGHKDSAVDTDHMDSVAGTDHRGFAADIVRRDSVAGTGRKGSVADTVGRMGSAEDIADHKDSAAGTAGMYA
ncbi:MAG: hypothetical protein K2G13_08875 [Muribaculaceae bacterium]|nr:hypothetical protein [Muribaculaceae bacterium]